MTISLKEIWCYCNLGGPSVRKLENAYSFSHTLHIFIWSCNKIGSGSRHFTLPTKKPGGHTQGYFIGHWAMGLIERMFHCPQQRRKGENGLSQSLSLHGLPCNILGRSSDFSVFFCFLLFPSGLWPQVTRVEVVHFLLEEARSFLCIYFWDIISSEMFLMLWPQKTHWSFSRKNM